MISRRIRLDAESGDRSFLVLVGFAILIAMALAHTTDLPHAEASGTLFCSRYVSPQPDKCVSPVVQGMYLVEAWKQLVTNHIHVEIWIPMPGGQIINHCVAGNAVWCPASAGTYEAYAYHDNFDPNVNVFLEAVYHN
jgi:hypothetical protein